MTAPVRLVVLYGGRSAEHDVSCVSALNVAQAIDPNRYDLRLIGITTDGRWVDATEAANRLAPGAPALPIPEGAGSRTLVPSEVAEQAGERAVVVLPLLHGPMGEDGTV
ncbi:MAG: hypothetical protein J2P57_16515, partial [Acidimicrobiaceae bacterium]|nr:hypothetical protein [Acidimicrobiaceae bacterium]